MKLIKQPIQIVVHFTQKGEIKPIAFLYKNCHYKVVNILHVKGQLPHPIEGGACKSSS